MYYLYIEDQVDPEVEFEDNNPGSAVMAFLKAIRANEGRPVSLDYEPARAKRKVHFGFRDEQGIPRFGADGND